MGPLTARQNEADASSKRAIEALGGGAGAGTVVGGGVVADGATVTAPASAGSAFGSTLGVHAVTDSATHHADRGRSFSSRAAMALRIYYVARGDVVEVRPVGAGLPFTAAAAGGQFMTHAEAVADT